MAELRTRKPTGKVAFPLLLVEGDEKSGKTFALLQLSASERVGRTFVLDSGDGTVDEYARLGPYEVLVHDGTWTSMIEQVREAVAVPSDPEHPNVVGIDAGNYIWALLKGWVDARARRSKKGRETLKLDPDAEVDAATNLWNDAKDRWAEMLRLLKMFPGVGVITATGREVVKFQNGVPLAGQTDWSVDVEKTTAGWASAWVRMRRPHQATLIAVRHLDIHLPEKGMPLPDDMMLEHLVFDLLGAGGFDASGAVQGQLGTPVAAAKGEVLAALRTTGLDADQAKAEAARLWGEYKMPSGGGEVSDEALAFLLADIRDGAAPSVDGGEHAVDDHAMAHAREVVGNMTIEQVKDHLQARRLRRDGTHDAQRERLTAAVYEDSKAQNAARPQDSGAGAPEPGGAGAADPEGAPGAQNGPQAPFGEELDVCAECGHFIDPGRGERLKIDDDGRMLHEAACPVEREENYA